MAVCSITYFERPGPANTEATIELVKQRATELGLQHVVVATTTGRTALAVAEALEQLPLQVVAVASHAGFDGNDKLNLEPQLRAELQRRGVPIQICSHALSGVGRSIARKFGGIAPAELIAHALRCFSQGVKVGIEISIMAADGGLVPTDREIIAIGGTGNGADAAIVLQAAHANNLFDLRVREIICMPR